MAVNNQNSSYSFNIYNWGLVRDCVEGERAVKARGELYLPRLSGQSKEDYERYTKKVHFFGATGRAADGLHGDIFAKPPTMSGNPPEKFDEFLQDIDLMGTSLDQFASDIVWDCMQTNWGGILVDYSKDADKANRLQAEKLGYGAFLHWYKAEDVINWRYDIKDGKMTLVLVVLREPYTVVKEGDPFTEYPYTRYRVLSFDENGNYIQSVWDDRITLEYPTEKIENIRINGEPLRELPFYPCPGKVPEKSMLLDLSFENIGHYQQSADYENGKHYTSIPTPIAVGVTPPVDDNTLRPKDVYVGGTKFIFFNSETGGQVEVKYLEFSGAGIDALAKGLTSSEERMAILGAHIITGEKRGVETAEAARIHRAGENGVLASFVKNISEQLTKAVKLKAAWDGLPADSLVEWGYALNTNYDYRQEDAQVLATLLQGRQAGELPRISLYRWLINRELIPEDWDFDMFLEEVEKDNETVEPAPENIQPSPFAQPQSDTIELPPEPLEE
jgi:hypothetical protein